MFFEILPIETFRNVTKKTRFLHDLIFVNSTINRALVGHRGSKLFRMQKNRTHPTVYQAKKSVHGEPRYKLKTANENTQFVVYTYIEA